MAKEKGFSSLTTTMKREIMQSHHATIVTDLGFGDAGKGSIVDFLARTKKVSAVVRHNGGGQAAHNVVTPEGKHHTFRQFGSGTFVPGVRTHLSRFMLVDPVTLLHEGLQISELGCGNPFTRLTIDGDALVVTPFHKAANRLREWMRGEGKHGSCGMGIGETMADRLEFSDPVRVRDLLDPVILARKFVNIQERKRGLLDDATRGDTVPDGLLREVERLTDPNFPKLFAEQTFEFAKSLTIVSGEFLGQLAIAGDLLFEGAQGVLLDEWYGFHPHTTWSTTTPANALKLLDEIEYAGSIEKLGLLRAYHTRHGAGPFVTEDRHLQQWISEDYNTSEGWQGEFRLGWFDMVMAKYALEVSGGVDSIAITNIDRFLRVPNPKICTAYEFSKGDISSKELGVICGLASWQCDDKFFVSELCKKEGIADLAYQEILTNLLRKAEPQYGFVDRKIDRYLRYIEEQLGVRISVESYGPTAKDKYLK